MVQIKISVAFVLVATAIAPIMIVALPVTLKNGAELNARDNSEMLERSFEHLEARTFKQFAYSWAHPIDCNPSLTANISPKCEPPQPGLLQ